MWKRTWKSKWARFISRKNGTNWQKLIEYPQNCGRYARREMPKKPTRKHENSSTGITSTVPTNYFNASMDPLSLIYTSPKKKIQWPRVVDILLDHITIQNDRNTKVIDFQNVSPVMTCSVSDFVNSSISIWICALGCKGYLAPSEKKSSLSWRISLIIWGMLL